MVTKIPPQRCKHKLKPISRRLAYKILEVIYFWTEFERVRKELNVGWDTNISHPVIDLILERIDSDRNTFYKMLKAPIYSREQQLRAMAKADKDIYNKKRRTHTWRRYKIGQTYRRSKCGKEVEKIFEEADSIWNEIKEIGNELDKLCKQS